MNEFIIEKQKFLSTAVGKNLAAFYREMVLPRYLGRGGDLDALYTEWIASFDFARVRVFPDAGRICYALLGMYGDVRDEYCEDVDTDVIAETIDEMRRGVSA